MFINSSSLAGVEVLVPVVVVPCCPYPIETRKKNDKNERNGRQEKRRELLIAK